MMKKAVQMMSKMTGHNAVNHPSHYKGSKGLEVTEVLENFLSPDELRGFYKGNVIKYVLRSQKKNGKEDLEKASKYLGWLIEATEEKDLLETIYGPIPEPKEFPEFTVSLFNGEGKETYRTRFFDKESAEAFAREHGGVVSYR